MTQMDVEHEVRRRYGAAARQVEANLCCPIRYDPALLAAVPPEVLEKDYGCGDPSRHIAPGETVLDLGSGGGKICFMAAKVVGPKGRVIGVDMNEEMLALARRNAPEAAQRLGYANVEFRRGRIQDLAGADPPVEDASVDVVVSNCVLNLVRLEDRRALFAGIRRVLAPGGRAVISDIVSDAQVPAHLRRDPELWTGCVSGAFREDLFLNAFAEAGFVGIEEVERAEIPWRVVEGIAFRSVTVRSYRGEDGPCRFAGHAVIYRGPFRQVLDDDGHTFRRGERTEVCEKTFRVLTRAPYADRFEAVHSTTAPSSETCRGNGCC